MNTTTTATPRRIRMRSVAAAFAALAMGATLLGTAPAANAAEDEAQHGALTWDSGFVIDTGKLEWADPTRFHTIGKAQGTYATELEIDLAKTGTDGQPIEGAEFTVEWVVNEPTAFTSAWMERDVWEDVRDRDLEQARLDAVDAYVEARDAWADRSGERGVASYYFQAVEYDAQTELEAENAEEGFEDVIREYREEQRIKNGVLTVPEAEAELAPILEELGITFDDVTIEIFDERIEAAGDVMDERRDEHAAAADAIAAHLAPHADTEFTLVTDANGEADLDLLGHNNYISGAFVITEVAVPEGVSEEGLGSSLTLSYGGGAFATDHEDVFVSSALTTTAWDQKRPEGGNPAHYGHTGSNLWQVDLEVVNEITPPDSSITTPPPPTEEPPTEEPPVEEPPVTTPPTEEPDVPRETIPATVRPPVVSG